MGAIFNHSLSLSLSLSLSIYYAIYIYMTGVTGGYDFGKAIKHIHNLWSFVFLWRPVTLLSFFTSYCGGNPNRAPCQSFSDFGYHMPLAFICFISCRWMWVNNAKNHPLVITINNWWYRYIYIYIVIIIIITIIIVVIIIIIIIIIITILYYLILYYSILKKKTVMGGLWHSPTHIYSKFECRSPREDSASGCEGYPGGPGHMPPAVEGLGVHYGPWKFMGNSYMIRGPQDCLLLPFKSFKWLKFRWCFMDCFVTSS